MDSKEFMAAVVSAAQAHAEEHALTATDFCTIWPKAKSLLTTVASMIVFLPGAGPVAGVVLKGLLTTGDQVYGMECPSAPKLPL